MKRFITILIAVFAAVVSVKHASAQAEYKLGKVTRAELERTEYPDVVQGADAVVLEEVTDLLIGCEKTVPDKILYYNVDRVVMRKIKILKPDGVRHATVSIVCENRNKEYVEAYNEADMEAYSYRLEGDEVIKTKLDTEDISVEQLPDGAMKISFTVPDAQAGGIIEYKYSKYALCYGAEAVDFAMQHEGIPVLSSRVEAYVYDPEYDNAFQFVQTGSEPIEASSRKKVRLCRSIRVATPPTRHSDKGFTGLFAYSGGRTMSITCKYYEFRATDLPAAAVPTDAAGVRLVLSEIR